MRLIALNGDLIELWKLPRPEVLVVTNIALVVVDLWRCPDSTLVDFKEFRVYQGGIRVQAVVLVTLPELVALLKVASQPLIAIFYLVLLFLLLAEVTNCLQLTALSHHTHHFGLLLQHRPAIHRFGAEFGIDLRPGTSEGRLGFLSVGQFCTLFGSLPTAFYYWHQASSGRAGGSILRTLCCFASKVEFLIGLAPGTQGCRGVH